MSSDADGPPAVLPGRASRRTVVRLTIVAENLAEPKELAMRGAGLTVRDAPEPGQGRLDAMLILEFDALLGWRDVEVALQGELHRLSRAFEGTPGAGYSGDGRGIGSHLI